MFVKAMPGNYKTAIDEAVKNTGRNVTCLLTDAFFWFCADLAHDLHAKWVPLWTAGPHSILAHVSTDLIRETLGPDGVRENREIDFLTGFSGVKPSDLPEGVAEELEDPFSSMLHKMGAALPRDHLKGKRRKEEEEEEEGEGDYQKRCLQNAANMTVCPSDDRHVAVLAFPYGTHAAPLLNLVRRTAADAPEVIFSFFSTKKSNASVFAGLDEEQLFNIRPYDVHDGLPDNYVPSNALEPIGMFVKAMPGNYKTAIDEAVKNTGRNVTCLLTDAFFWFCADLAHDLHAKWVPLWTAGPHSILAHVSTDLIRETLGPDGVRENREIDFLTGFSGVKPSDLPEGVAEELEDPFSSMLHKMGAALPRATAVAINSFAAVHPPIAHELECKFQLLLNVGPFILTMPQSLPADEDGCLPWLNTQEEGSVVYISFGSVIMPPPHELAALAEALEETKYAFIWAFRGNPEKQLPQGPFFGDQSLNTATLEHVWGIGVGLENGVFTKEGTVKVLQSIMSSENGKVMRQKIVELKDSAMAAAGPEGDSTKNFRTFTDIVTASNYEIIHPQHHGHRAGFRSKIVGAFDAARTKFSRRHHNHKH
uniref:Flavonoid 3-O-glucosyltransferase n=1 Tax=Cajanus cajan TaxID=3821 RepID=A0A151SRQ0_CAJCA|nr:Flavonoid 3-O-glucosyltransferase [Cajanus cajan]